MSLHVEQVARVTPREVREKMRSAPDRVHLVCAYPDEARCRQFSIDGALSLTELQRRLDTIVRDSILVFYCA